MCCKFFHIQELEEQIFEISLIAPHYIKGQTASIIDLYFKLNDKVFCKGYYLYLKYKKILLEAEGIILSGYNFNYKNYRKRVLLNYTIGFMKNTIEKIRAERQKNG